jgi:hypothetical protein
MLYFASKDGVYVWQGGPQVQKISAGIDEFWTGEYKRTFVPAAMAGTLGDLGYPYTVAHADMKYVNVMHYQTRNQIWWSFPVQSRPDRSLPVTLVWDYAHQAWSIYTMRPKSGTNGTLATCMYDGIVVRLDDSEEVVLTSSNHGTNGTLQRYDDDRTDPGTGAIGIPLVWLSGRLWKGNVRFNKRRPVRFNMLSTGQVAVNPPQYVLVGEEAHWVDRTSAPDTEVSGTVSTFPTDIATAASTLWGVWGDVEWAASGNSWTAKDWFWSKNEGSIRSRSVRVGLLDDADTQDRAPLVVMQAFVIESEAGGDTR